MILSFLNWNSGLFLALYSLLAAFSLASGLAIKHWMLTSSLDAEFIGDLSVLEIAFLAGGRSRAADVVALRLIEDGFLVINSNGSLSAAELNINTPSELAPFRTWQQLERHHLVEAWKPWIDPAVKNLIMRGLALPNQLLLRVRLAIFLIFTPVITLGVVRIWLGIERGRPVGFLVTLVVVSIAAAVIVGQARRFTTGAGERELTRLCKNNARALRAPLPHEVVFAFAVDGSVVLAGTALSQYALIMKEDAGGVAGAGTGDSGGGGGCGGCGGH